MGKTIYNYIANWVLIVTFMYSEIAVLTPDPSVFTPNLLVWTQNFDVHNQVIGAALNFG